MEGYVSVMDVIDMRITNPQLIVSGLQIPKSNAKRLAYPQRGKIIIAVGETYGIMAKTIHNHEGVQHQKPCFEHH